MKTNSVVKKLGNFKSVTDENGALYFYSRINEGADKVIKVVNQGNGRCVALPIIIEADGEERVSFHATTIKSLVEFLKG